MNSFVLFKNKNFTIFFFTVFLSNIGSWIQNVALSWLALSLKNTSSSFGLISFLGSIPSLIFSFIGGYLADVFDNKKILALSQTFSAFLAFFIGFSVLKNSMTYETLAVLAFLNGIVSAISYPLYYTIITGFVEKKDLSSLIALNSLQFNLSRFLGPTIFGFLVFLTGLGGCFLANGLSYLPFIFFLFYYKNEYSKKYEMIDNNFFKTMKDGLKYIKEEKKLLPVIWIVFIYSILVLPFLGLMPYIIKNGISDSTNVLAIVMGLLGIGALFGALFLTVFPKGEKGTFSRFIISGFLFPVFLFFLSISANLITISVISLVIGFFMVLFYASANAYIHMIASQKYRGRVASIFTTVYLGVYPVGVLLTGIVAETYKLSIVMIFEAVIGFASFLLFYLFNKTN